MPWYMPNLSDYFKKKVCIYLLHRYLGQFFEEKLRLNQLSLDIYNGTGIVRDVSLDVQALNELGEKQNWPMEFVDGYFEQLFVSVPWTSLLKDSTELEVTGLKVTVQPKQRHESATSMFESMWSSMTSSFQLAQEYMQQDTPHTEDSQPFEGIEKFAQTIDSVLTRVKVKFTNTTIQIEHVPQASLTGVSLRVTIGLIEYLDEAGNDPPEDSTKGAGYTVSSFTTKKLHLDGVVFATVEFPSVARTFSRSVFNPSGGSEKRDSLSVLIEDGDGGEREESQERQERVEDNRHSIVFGKLTGRQEIRIRLKQSEDVSGSKVSIEVNLGGFTLFLSPRQLHVLLELANGISSPDIEDTSNVPPRQKCVEKPMTVLDYQRVEQELQEQLHPASHYNASAGLQGIHGWSTAALDDDTDDNFLPMCSTTGGASGMYDSAVSRASSSMESSLTSSMVSSLSDATTLRSRRRGNIESDPTAEITHFQIRIASLAVILLHEDLLTLSADSSQMLIPSSVAQMAQTAETFFSTLGAFNIAAYGGSNFDDTRVIFEKCCKRNHLRLIAAPIQIEGKETTTLTAFSVNGKLTAAKMELLECLHNGSPEPVEYVRILNFSDESLQNVASSNALRTKPSLKLAFKHEMKCTKSGNNRKTHIPRSDIGITLDTCTVDIDITIVDRITALLNANPVCVITKPGNNVWTTTVTSPQVITDSRLDLTINSPQISLKIRFPIPDLRPSHDMQRQPWWKRHVRQDYLTLKLREATADTVFQTSQLSNKYTLQCKSIDLLYYEKEKCVPLILGQVTLDEKHGSVREGFDWPRLEIQVLPHIKPEVDYTVCMEKDVDPMTQSFYHGLKNERTGPFSSKRVVHESDTPHSKPHQDDSEELVIPGDQAEMSTFIEATTLSARIKVDISLPVVHLNLTSKHLYEVLYNRINSDLLLWEPSAPKTRPPVSTPTAGPACGMPAGSGQQYFENLASDDAPDQFAMCKSGIQYDSDSSSSSDTPITSLFHSTRPKPHSTITSSSSNNTLPLTAASNQSHLALSLRIASGRVSMAPPVRDPTGAVVPNHQGAVVLQLSQGHVFTVTGYGGDESVGYVCVQVGEVQLQHSDMIPVPNSSIPLDKIPAPSVKPLHSTIFKSEGATLVNGKGYGGQRDMLTVAVQIQANHETHHVKTVKVALGINKATLRHRMCLEPNTWITQLIDFFNVLDYPIPGYFAKDVLTELHLHLWDCAIDYRPFYLPLRSVVTLGNFSMSSHLSAQSNTSTLRFIAEECVLFISEKSPPKKGVPSEVIADLKKDYISVIEMGLFELSLRTNDKNSGINPHIDLRASNNIVHVRTCADTGKALIELMTYFARDGDLSPTEPISCNNDSCDNSNTIPVSCSTSSSPRRRQSETVEEEQLVAVDQPQNISKLSTSQHRQVNELLGEAMEECLTVSENTENDLPSVSGAKMFFFPDEGQVLADLGKPPLQVTTELGDITFRRNKSNDTDDEFCIVGEEAGLGIMPKNGVPEIRWLTNDPLHIVDNHFTVPLGKTDLLRPPKHFPTPTMRYTLCDMTVVWHMYGGRDFAAPSESNPSGKSKGKVNFASDHPLPPPTVPPTITNRHLHPVAYSSGGGGTGAVVYFPEVVGAAKAEAAAAAEDKKYTSEVLSWQAQGGKGRSHEVLVELQLSKVRFVHEVYPENTSQASFQVLIINEVEIRDRLESSGINKFLYQYTSEAKPKQSHSHMLVVKATHIRPDHKLKAQECSLKVSILPLRLNIDQDSLVFLINFFSELSGNTTKPDDSSALVSSKQNTPTHQPPVMTVNEDNERELKEQAHKIVDDNLLILLEEEKKITEKEKKTSVASEEKEDCPPIYFRSVIFKPEVPIRLDYTGKHVDMTHGSLPGLLMGLGQLNCSELCLKRLSNRHGILGFDKLVTYCLQEWLMEIKRNQLPRLLGGVGPMHVLVQLVQGIFDLFWLPIEQYQKDGRIVRGLQRGANSFTTSTAMAALELTSRLIHLIQITAETAYDMMSPGPSVRRRPSVGGGGAKRRGGGHKRRYRQPPQDIRTGVTMAYNVLKQGIEETAENIVRVAHHEREQKGYSGAVGGVLRQIPPSVFVKPIILASEATNNLLGGMHNQLVPDAKREANQKWKNDDG